MHELCYFIREPRQCEEDSRRRVHNVKKEKKLGHMVKVELYL